MRLNRDHDKAKDYVQDVKKEVAKAVSDKKNDWLSRVKYFGK